MTPSLVLGQVGQQGGRFVKPTAILPIVHNSEGIAVRRGQILLSVFTLRRGDTDARESLSASNRGCQASSPEYRPCSLFRRYATYPIRVTSAPMAHPGRARQVSGRRRQPPYLEARRKARGESPDHRRNAR